MLHPNYAEANAWTDDSAVKYYTQYVFISTNECLRVIRQNSCNNNKASPVVVGSSVAVAFVVVARSVRSRDVVVVVVSK